MINVNDFDGFYDAYIWQQPYADLYKWMDIVFAAFTNIIFLFTAILVISEKSSISKHYRRLLFLNILAPTVLTNFITLIAKLNLILPFPMIGSTAIFGFGWLATYELGNIMLLLIYFCVFTVLLTVLYNYLLICHPTAAIITILRRVSIACILFLFLHLAATFGLANYDNPTDLEALFQYDPRIRIIYDNWRIYLQSSNKSLLSTALNLEMFIFFFIVLVFIIFMLYRSHSQMSSTRLLVSVQTYRSQRQVALLMLIYFCILLICLAIPVLGITYLATLSKDKVSRVPVTVIFSPPLVLFAPFICFVYIFVVKTYRRAVKNQIFSLFSKKANSIQMRESTFVSRSR